MAPSHLVFITLHSIAFVLAYEKLVVPGVTKASTSSTYSVNKADLAVDGNTKQDISHCSHTGADEGRTEAWLRIDLNETYSIKSVKFWYRNDRSEEKRTARLPGYSIRVSNDSALPPFEASCYKDQRNSKPLPTIIENDCQMTSRYIWIYQNNKLEGPCPMLEICEVQIFGCPTGRFGENCITCTHCKNNKRCNIVTGACDKFGCAKANFQPPSCRECIAGRYGLDCEIHCSSFCRDNLCDKINGSCSDGCKAGYKGSFCNQTCPSGAYGDGCNSKCGGCYGKMTCNHINGSCSKGCDKGLKGKLCKMDCSAGEYGENCLYNCTGNCLNNEVCDRFEGKCESCRSGYEGTKCDIKCQRRRYGVNCSMDCGHCLDLEPCNHIHGKCNSGCEAGWQISETCHLECINGTYGKDCSKNCSDICPNGEFCDKKDGGCPRCSKESDACNEQENNSKTGVIAGSLCTILVAAMVTTIIIVLVYRRRNQKERGSVNEIDEISNTSRRKQLEENCYQSDSLYYNTEESRSKDIQISELLDMIKLLEIVNEDDEDNFHREFDSIPFGEQHDIPCTAGKLPENLSKNRFKTTYPYDHSRVILKSAQTSDYINANFIKDGSGKRTYIASQGPKQNTVDEFWQMVWQEDIYVIAMVTNLIEGAAVKCEAYWPDSIMKKIVKGIYSIELLTNKAYANFQSHHLTVTNNETKASRQILHLQYTTWPDHGTPSPLELLEFYHYVSRAMENYPKNKLLVHCSAGIGRTGTFIALDALHRQGLKEGKMNIVEYVHSMRKDRMNMIQNESQYRFLYYVLYESFRGRGRVLAKDIFIKEVETQALSNTAVNFSSLRKEFMKVDSVKPVFGENEIKFGRENVNLNMTKTVLPADRMRVILSSHVTGRSTYVNAVPLSTFKTRDCLIAAQYPVPGAAVDLIRLLIDQECSTLVSFNPLSDIPFSKEWFAQSADIALSYKYNVQVESGVKLSENISKLTVKVKAPKNMEWQTVHVYEVTTWNINRNLPNDVDTLLDVVKRVYRDEKVDQEHKLVTLSRDGATGCGVFCAVYNAIQQLQQDEEVDMFTIVRQLQSRRPEMISTWSDYMFCCQVAARYCKESEDMCVNPDVNADIQEENIYANA